MPENLMPENLMIGAVELPLPLEQQLRTEARSAWPRECCGLIEGSPDNESVRVTALHPMPNIAELPDSFEIDPAAHIALLRTLRGTGREIVGCYHSHPNGRAEPSERDCARASEGDFLWLICAVGTKTATSGIAAFVSTGRSFLPVPIVVAPGPAGRAT